jgi:hypothetical protein
MKGQLGRRYFKEIVRVAAPGAFVVFNIFSEDCFDPQTVEAWIESGDTHPCFLSTAYVERFFVNNGFRLVGRFVTQYGVGRSEYLVLQC